MMIFLILKINMAMLLFIIFNKLIFLARKSYMRSSLSNGNRGGIVITHREYVRDITPSAAFTKWDLPINPGLGITFPWLAQLAESYEEYAIRAMIFEYKSLCSDTVIGAGGSMGMGSVIIATNYNPNNTPFVDKRTMENYDGSSAKKPSVSNIHVVDVKKSHTPLGVNRWVRTGGIKENEDLRLYDIGTFSIATVGQDAAATGTIGELWVAYEIEFFKPKYSGSIGSNLLTDHYTLTDAGAGGFGAGAPFGLNNALAPLSPIKRGANTYVDFSPLNNGLNRINFRSEHQGMTFMIMYSLKGAGENNVRTIEATASTNVIPGPNWFNNQQQPQMFNTGNGGAAGNQVDTMFFAIIVHVIAAANGPWNIVFNTTAGNYPAGTKNMDIWVMQINGTPEPGPV